MTRRFTVTIGDDDTPSRVPDPPRRTHRRPHASVAILEPTRAGFAGPSGSGGYVAGGPGSTPPVSSGDAGDCVDCD